MPFPKRRSCNRSKFQVDMVGEGLFATSHHNGCEKQMTLVNQPGLECLAAIAWSCPQQSVDLIEVFNLAFNLLDK